MTPASPLPDPISPGTPAYRRVGIALFLAGFTTFSLLYCVQPMLPIFAAEFQVSATESSLALSLSTAGLAIAIICAAVLAEGVGRRSLIFVSMASSAILTIAGALAPNWGMFLITRMLAGCLMGGMPAVAMAYLAEEIDPRGLGLAMGLLIGGNAFGGMCGRVLGGILAESLSWRAALATLGGAGLLSCALFRYLLPASVRFRPQRGLSLAHHMSAWLRHLRNPAMRPLFAVGFLGMGAFVALYNYAGFRLSIPPFSLNQKEIGLVFMVYLFGIAASSLAGALADRLGRGRVLAGALIVACGGVGLTLVPELVTMVGGIALITSGFFAAHSVASSWIGQLATEFRGHASSLYLLGYYLGSSVIGTAAGRVWDYHGWPAVALSMMLVLGLALLSAVAVSRRLKETRCRQTPNIMPDRLVT